MTVDGTDVAEKAVRRRRHGRGVYDTLVSAVRYGTLDDVRQQLSQCTAADVNMHHSSCIRRPHFPLVCSCCDTALMAAVRRGNIDVMRLLLTHGADPSLEISGAGTERKTALLIAVFTHNAEAVNELVTSGADVNEPIGSRYGTLLLMATEWHSDEPPFGSVVARLVQAGADPNDAGGHDKTPLAIALFWRQYASRALAADAKMRVLLPVTSNLDAILFANRRSTRTGRPISIELVTLFLQHGVRIDYGEMYLAKYDQRALRPDPSQEYHCERFIELLRAADTDFSGARQRQVSDLDDYDEELQLLNLAVLDEQLSQPLTLQTSCVISVRRQIRSVRDCGMWASIDELALPQQISQLLKLTMW